MLFTRAVSSGELFHFQGWKKGKFFSFLTRPPSHNTHAMLITREGFIPLRLHLYGETTDTTHSLAERSAIPSLHYLLQASSRQNQRGNALSYRAFESSHCKEYQSNLKGCLSHIWSRDVDTLVYATPLRNTKQDHHNSTITLSNPSPFTCDESTVTLVLVSSALHEDVFSGILEESMRLFRGHQVSDAEL